MKSAFNSIATTALLSTVLYTAHSGKPPAILAKPVHNVAVALEGVVQEPKGVQLSSSTRATVAELLTPTDAEMAAAAGDTVIDRLSGYYTDAIPEKIIVADNNSYESEE